MMPWELNMALPVFFIFLNVLHFRKSASTTAHSKGFLNLLHVSWFKVVNQNTEWPRQPALNLSKCCWTLAESPPSCTRGSSPVDQENFHTMQAENRKRQEGRINIQEHIAESQSVCKHIRLLKFPYFIHQAVSVHAPFSLSKVVPECWQYSSQPSKIDCNGFNSRLVIGYIPKVLDLVRLLGCCRQIICCSEWGADDSFTFWKIQGPFGCLGVWGLWLHTVRLRMAYN